MSSPASSPSTGNNKETEEKPRFRGTWQPLVRDSVPGNYINFTPEVKKAALVLHELEEQQQQQPKEGNGEGGSSSSTASEALVADDEVEVCRQRVMRLQQKYEGVDLDSLAEKLIRSKCKQAAMAGLISSGFGLPGWGSLTAVFVGGTVDVAITSKLQYDLILELFILYGCIDMLATVEQRQHLLLKIMGIGGIAADEMDVQETEKAGERIATRATEEAAKRSIIYSVPFFGSVFAACSNIAGTFITGKRTLAFIKKNEQVMKESWRSSLNRFLLPEEMKNLTKTVYDMANSAPSAQTVKNVFKQYALKIGESGKHLMKSLSSSNSS